MRWGDFQPGDVIFPGSYYDGMAQPWLLIRWMEGDDPGTVCPYALELMTGELILGYEFDEKSLHQEISSEVWILRGTQEIKDR